MKKIIFSIFSFVIITVNLNCMNKDKFNKLITNIFPKSNIIIIENKTDDEISIFQKASLIAKIKKNTKKSFSYNKNLNLFINIDCLNYFGISSDIVRQENMLIISIEEFKENINNKPKKIIVVKDETNKLIISQDYKSFNSAKNELFIL